MRRAIGKKAGILATVALLIAVLVISSLNGLAAAPRAVVAGPHLVAPHATLTPAKAPASSSPAPGALGNVSAVVSFSTAITGYIHLPYTVAFSAVITNLPAGTIHYKNKTNTWVNVEIRDVSGVCQGSYGRHHHCPQVVNISLNDTFTNGTTSWSANITLASLQAVGGHPWCPNAPCAYAPVLPNDQYQVVAWVTLNNTVSNLSSSSLGSGYLIAYDPAATLVAPSGVSAISTGNVSVGIDYTGSYVGGVQVTAYQGTTTAGKIVYSQGLFAPGPGEHVVVAISPWYVAVAGTYLVVVNITAPYGSSTFSTMVTAIPAGITVYQNASSWQNQSLWGGVSPGALGALLLVAGLVIGMIVALALGRSMWGAPKAAPAQAWQSKPTNECSVCHQTFATEAELKDHQKTAHGM